LPAERMPQGTSPKEAHAHDTTYYVKCAWRRLCDAWIV